MIPLHSVRPAIPRELARAAAMLHSYADITRFRLTGISYTAESRDYTVPLEYYNYSDWESWTNNSLAVYAQRSDLFAEPTEEQIEAAYAMFEEKP